jgi:hypothetical protein
MAIDLDATVLAACMDAWGETNSDGTPSITYMPGHAAPYDIQGVFDEAYTEVNYEGENPVGSRRPMLGVRLSAFQPSGAPPCRGELFRIRGKLYSFAESHPDGHGHLKVFLQEAPDPDRRRR